MTPRRPALIVHTFFAVNAASGSAGESTPALTADAVTGLWRGLVRLDLTEPIAPYPADLPDDYGPATPELRVLAARQRVVPEAFYEALAFRCRDVVGVSVLLAPNDDGVGWQELRDRWASAVPPVSGAEFSTTMVYLGLLDHRHVNWLGRRVGEARWARRLDLLLPGPHPGPGWTATWSRIADSLLMWVLPADDGYAHSRYLVLADLADEAELDRLTWLSDGRALPPLTRYVLCGAELRHQEKVLEAAVPGLRAAIRRTDRACETLAELLRATDPSDRQLRAAALELATVQAEGSGLIAATADVSKMAETVRGIRDNMEAALGHAVGRRLNAAVEQDRTRAVWLADQLRIELTYVDATWRKADQLNRLAAAVVDERHRRRQEVLTLIQASILGSLLMGLAAIQSLQYQVPLAGPLVAPLICVLGILALLLPAAVLHWPRPGTSVPRRRWLVAGGSVFGAALGWLMASIGWWQARDEPAPSTWSALLAAAGATVVTASALLLIRPRKH
ncbi:CATRA conflict system CASPASE/TPR repeat-associated protein [Micromonospora sp. WMMD964]|uniref:CATRA conflict system CASPASE/TPR repeat-associated protein n=1 Tax=Micromonospora sp. WMMD964 TaxID=3016091 RepID=UPI00249ADC6C|nr:CATRA conflict system CASPASE/TPR repeat-associated protein [Micromonospora sp. WMMD964]WFF00342.1 BN6_48550 family protein [Micromonospora sp. WMMD964]